MDRFDFHAFCRELLDKYDMEWRARERIEDALKATPPPEPLTDEELWAIGEDYLDDMDQTYAIKFARAVLERWGQ